MIKMDCKELGVERLLLKNGEMSYFLQRKILSILTQNRSTNLGISKQNFGVSEMKEKSDKLVLIIKNIHSVNKGFKSVIIFLISN